LVLTSFISLPFVGSVRLSFLVGSLDQPTVKRGGSVRLLQTNIDDAHLKSGDPCGLVVSLVKLESSAEQQ